MRPKIVVFASGTKDGGGSGFENLVTSRDLDADVTAVVSNHEQGGVRQRAERLGIPFIYFAGPYDAEHYQKIVADSGAEWVALSGWLKKAAGLDPQKTINIHPTLFSQGDKFRGAGMYGDRIHEAVRAALDAGEITESGFTMHFVTEEYDEGPAFFEHRVPLKKGMTAKEIGDAVRAAEHEWQPKLTDAVVHGAISWDGEDPATLVVPPDFP